MQAAEVQFFSSRAEHEPLDGKRKHYWFVIKAALNFDWGPEVPSPQAAVDGIPKGGAHPLSSSLTQYESVFCISHCARGSSKKPYIEVYYRICM